MSRIQYPLRAILLTSAIACVSAGAVPAFGDSQTFAASFTEFDAPGAGSDAGQGTQVFGMNANGDTVGAYTASDGTRHAFVRVSDGSFVSFTPDSGTTPVAINGSRETTGSVATDSGQTSFVAAADGAVTTFGVPDATAAQRLAINDRGAVTGDFLDSDGLTRAYVRSQKGHVKAFDAPGTPKETVPSAIDNHGDIAGLFEDSSSLFHGFLRDASGNTTVIDVPSAARTTAVGINNDATVVDLYRLSTTGPAHAYIRASDGTLTTFAQPMRISAVIEPSVANTPTVAVSSMATFACLDVCPFHHRGIQPHLFSLNRD